MSVTIKVNNFSSTNIKEKTYLPTGPTAGATSLVVESGDNISQNLYVYVGSLGSDASELRVVSSISNDTITVPALEKNHDDLTEVTVLRFNQIKLYRASNVNGTVPADGSFSLLGSALDLDLDNLQTTYIDDIGSSAYWYKFTFYNSAALTETNLADAVAVRGGGYLAYAKLDDIRRRAGLANNKWVTDEVIDEKRQAAQQMINSTLAGMYTIPFTAPINQLIAECTMLLAAGYLLTDSYGPLTSLNTNEGQQMIDRVMNDKKTGILDRLNTKDLILTGADGVDTSIPGTGNSFSGWPNSTTATTDPSSGGSVRKIRMSDRY